MRKLILIISLLTIFLSGCISLCPDCDDGDPCTTDYCEGISCKHTNLDGSQIGCNSIVPPCKMQSCLEGSCVLVNITNCCGNGICESNEDISICSADCASSIKLDCVATDQLIPILLKLEKELDTEFVYCTITNNGASEMNVVFNAEVPGFSDKFSKSLELYPGLSERIGVKFSWKDKMHTNKETTDASIKFSAEHNGLTLASQTQNILISPKEDIVWSLTSDGEEINLAHSLAAWVTPHDQCVSTLISSAKELAPGRSLGGYANYGGLSEGEKANRTLAQARAIFYASKGAGISYVNTPISFSGSQHVKMPADSLVDKSGNCVDGTVLFASAFEALGMNPVLVIIPAHTLVGVETYPASNRYVFIETTMVGSASFEEAVNEGSRQYNEYKDGFDINVIDVATQRTNITPFPSFSVCSMNQSCSDGTSAGACSLDKPKLCTGTGFVDAATVCGCPDAYYALRDNCISSILKNETFVLETSVYNKFYYWGPNLQPGTFVSYKYMVNSNQPIQIFIVPSKEDYNKLKDGVDFMHYPVFAGSNTLSYDQVVTHASNGGIVIYNDGGDRATISLQVFAEPA
jgi:hypothetical protein